MKSLARKLLRLRLQSQLQLVGAHLRVPSTIQLTVGRRARLLSAVVAVVVVVASQYRGLACS
ncbi:hypothetical protein GALMADRAFT_257317 [Galerina marginata CBS 339.88]|uniref:Uncharacterized protein n=1 Tax=Galerina marginata (strain CBS 339.88) TaxID=685588 RepID=A0A067SMS3_GALM3|nr:hypothetical protein GALMADRAFT_257317 [Galerina marginata CBS 339.88]